MKYFLVALFLVNSLISLGGCDNSNPNSSQNNKSSIIYKDIPCHSEGILKTSSDDNFNFSWVLNNNILNIESHFMVTCGSAFKDSIIYQNNILSVNIQDTSHLHFRCSCPHGTQVSVNVGTEKEVRFLFAIKSFTSSEYHQLLDTLLVIK